MKKIIFLLILPLTALAQEPVSTIQSQGSCVKSQVADKVSVNAQVSVLEKKYQDSSLSAQSKYNTLVNLVKKISDKLVVNSNLSIQEEYSYENNQQNFKGIRSTYQITINTNPKDLNSVVNTLVNQEVKVNNIVFQLEEETRKKLVQECLIIANQEAKQMAQKVAQGLEVTLGKVQNASYSVNQPSHGPHPYMMRTMAKGAMESDSQISPNELEVRVDTQVSFNINQKE